MKWPTIDQVRDFVALPTGYAWDYIKREEIDVAIEFFPHLVSLYLGRFGKRVHEPTIL